MPFDQLVDPRRGFNLGQVATARKHQELRIRHRPGEAAMIERGSYAFGERVSALLGAAASRTIALVQQTLRATNPAGFMQAARFLAGDDTPPLGSGLTMPLLMIQGEKDRVTPAAANAELLELGNAERFQKVVKGIGVIATARRLGPQIVAQDIAWSIPCNQAKPTGKAGQLITPVQRVRADAVQEQHGRQLGLSRLHVAEAIAGVTIPRCRRDFGEA
jgi:hypothetical protein